MNEKKQIDFKSELRLEDDKVKVEIIQSFIKENRRQVEWIKNLDFKAVQYCVLFNLVSIGWLITNGAHDISKFWLISGFLVLPVSGVLVLVRNHMRHYELNRQWQKAVASLRLHEEGQYIDKPVIDLLNHEIKFHIGRILYAIPLIATAVISCSIIGGSRYSGSEIEHHGVGSCILAESNNSESGIRRIVGQNKSTYTTFSFFFSKGKLILGEDYRRLAKSEVEKDYEEIEYPKFDAIFSPAQFISLAEDTTK